MQKLINACDYLRIRKFICKQDYKFLIVFVDCQYQRLSIKDKAILDGKFGDHLIICYICIF